MTIPEPRRRTAHSAGILLYRRAEGGVEVLLAHPGGPFWRNRDAGAWMIPKGMVEPGEDSAAAALREFEEEMGTRLDGVPRLLCQVRQAGGKIVHAFVMEGDLDADAIVSNSFTLEHPRGSGQIGTFPEIDRAAWMMLAEARAKILPSQAQILDALEQLLGQD